MRDSNANKNGSISNLDLKETLIPDYKVGGP